MQQMNLNGTWWLRHADPGAGLDAGWPDLGVGGQGSLVAQVPGDVHKDLVQNGVIDEPLHARNAEQCGWMEAQDWWYSREFDVPAGFSGDRVELQFDGLDTTAEIWLNGRLVGAHDNMFVPQILDVTSTVREGRNLLVVRLDVGLRAAEGKDVDRYSRMLADPPTPRMWIRKAQFTFGWDWAPRLLTCGIWRDVTLRSYRELALRDVCLRSRLHDDSSAQVTALLEIENLSGEDISAQVGVDLTGHGEARASGEHVLHPGRQTVTAVLDLPAPALWWPAPLGAPNLYDCRVSVLANGREAGTAAFRYGVREVALLQEPLAGEGESFVLTVNRKKVFCKGADWVPADGLIARVSSAKYRALVRLASEANFNMFRIWGGGIFEHPYFYELCDEFGILVWQDFLYACSYYPDDDPAFAEEARREAEAAVRALRNHACLALWCGNNENQWIHYQHVQSDTAADRCQGERLYDAILPEVCARLDPTRPYWPSSPFGGDDPNSETCGDRHSWDVSILNPTVESRIDYAAYATDRGKFISEFGVLAPPALDSLRQFLPAGEVSRESPSWAFHNNAFEQGTIQAALKAYWQPADELDLDHYLQMSQLVQAEALSFALEHWRRRAFKTAGALFWMYSDCWGAVGWSIVDYYLRLKPSYYAVSRAFAPILAGIERDGSRLCFWLTNDTLRDVEGTLEYGLMDLHDATQQTHNLTVRLAAQSSTQVAEVDGSFIAPADEGRWVAFCRFTIDGNVVSRNRFFLPGFRFNAIDFPKARFSSQLEGGEVVVRAETYVWQLEIKAPRGVSLEDNYFDLLPGEERRIHIEGPQTAMQEVTVTALNA